ncbi:hypothetical protein CYMTET_9224 [Cymbomonas tetramitiformis]|uniref:Uncharacterized protein n=1 Tax=Cymbomonas tetramitiformis TaxID=36881 RepID=A0AAE0GRW9_9CHLO|nr:hypothetical protein CYMTET_9224 [Cymbomonas tetramitiformis]
MSRCNAWGNLPFSVMLGIVENFLRSKRRQRHGTACRFLMPVWDGDLAWELVKSLPEVSRAGTRNTRGALVRDDILVKDDGLEVWVRVCHDKTIQCRERQHWVLLRVVLASLLCPVQAVCTWMRRTAGRPGDSALFVTEKVVGRKVAVMPMTHDVLVTGIKALARKMGLNAENYAGHSLRRRGGEGNNAPGRQQAVHQRCRATRRAAATSATASWTTSKSSSFPVSWQQRSQRQSPGEVQYPSLARPSPCLRCVPVATGECALA